VSVARADWPETNEWREAMQLADEQVLVACLSGECAERTAHVGAREIGALARQSYREYLRSPADAETIEALLRPLPRAAVDVYVQLERDAEARDLYRYDWEDRRLIALARGTEAEGLPELDDPVADGRTSVALFLVANTEERRTMLDCGWLGQALMTSSPDHGIGLCPFGGTTNEALRARLGDRARLLYSFVGGRISPDQTQVWPAEQVDLHEPSATDKLRRHLARRLPAYMIPAQLVVLDALPLTANGKIDRNALPKPESQRSKTEYVAPRTELESQLCGLWQLLLKVERVGIYDNFFMLGGNSLLGTRFMTAVMKTYPDLKNELPLRLLFESPSIDKVADAIESILASKALDENRRRIEFSPSREAVDVQL
jgi:hypothetical protein